MNIINSTSGTVAFRLKQTKLNRETSIVFEYSFGRGNRLKYSTGYKTLPKNWDSKNQKIRSVSTINNREIINNRLKEIELNFIKLVSKLSEGEKKNKPTLKSIYDEVIGKRNIVKETSITFLKYIEDFIKLHEENIVNANGMKLSLTTVKSYKQTQKQLIHFNQEKKFLLNFNNIDMTFYYAFVSFLEENKFSLNTIGKHIKNIIALLNRATEDGINSNLKYKHRDFKRVSEKSTSIYLTVKEIDSLYDIDLTHNKDWQRARDIFIIGYYTGQRVSDYNGLSKNNIKTFENQKVFEIYQKKTKKTVYVPIHPKIQYIMDIRYKGDFPKKLSDQKINEYIKLVGRKANIKEDVSTKITIGGKIKKQKIAKYKLISTHTARRSFCTNAYLSKMPVIDIMALSGHTTEIEFYNYIKVTPQERAIKIADSAFFK